MFNLKEFIVRNIVNGVKNGTFTKEYANIMAVNYLVKGVLAENDVISVNTQIEEWEAEQNVIVETVEPGEDEEVAEDATEGIAEESTGEVTEEETAPESTAAESEESLN